MDGVLFLSQQTDLAQSNALPTISVGRLSILGPCCPRLHLITFCFIKEALRVEGGGGGGACRLSSIGVGGSWLLTI